MATGSFTQLPIRFGRYQVQKLLGKGAMGEVYLARDTQLERLVALKIPKLSAKGSEKLLKRLKTEAMAAAQIDHPCVCPVYDSGDIDGTPYIAMQYIEGETLKDHLKNQAKTPQEAVELIHQLAEGLAEAHSKKIYHRDLKPENIKLNRRGEPVIMDFGLAKLARRLTSDASLTQAGTTIGTPAYMSPEQANGDVKQIDHRSDIYALGVILYEMLTGQWPFMRGSIQVMGQKSVFAPPSPLTIKPELNPQLAAVCHKMIARQRMDRYQNAEEVIGALRGIDMGRKSAPVGVAAPAQTPASGQREIPAFEQDEETLVSIIARKREQAAASSTPAIRLRTMLGALVEAMRPTAPSRAESVQMPQSKKAAARPIVRIGSAVGVLLAAGLVLWAAGVFKVKTKDGILVIEVNEPGAIVFIDGEKVTVTWGDGEKGGHEAVVNVQPGDHKVRVTKKGFSVAARKLTFKEGDREVFNAELMPAEMPPVAATSQKTLPAPVPPAVASSVLVRDGPSLLKGHTGIVWGVAFSPDGKRLVSGSKDGTIRLWDVGVARQIREIAREKETWRTIAWSPVGNLIASGGDSNIVLWDAETGAALGRLSGHTGQIRGLAFSADGQQLATSSCDNQVKLWNIADRTLVKTFGGHTGFASAVALSRSGKWLASGSWDRTLKLWDTATGQIKFDLQNQPGVGQAVAISPDERLFASATSSGHVRIWNLQTGNMERELTFFKHPGRVWGLAFKPDGTALAVGSDRLLGLWNPATGSLIKELSPMHPSGVLSLAWSRDGRLLATGSGDVDNKQDGTIGLWMIGDPLPAGSVWKGKRSYRKGAYAGATVTYDLHVRERDGTKFIGHKFDNGSNRNRVEVEGEINGKIVSWREQNKPGGHDPNTVLTIEGELDNDAIQLTFKGRYSNGATNEGDGVLQRVAD